MSDVLDAGDLKSLLTAPIVSGQDLLRVRRMLGMNQSTFALAIGKSVSALGKAEESSLLPKDIGKLAKGMLSDHLSTIATRHLEELGVTSSGLVILSKIFSDRILNGEKVLSDEDLDMIATRELHKGE